MSLSRIFVGERKTPQQQIREMEKKIADLKYDKNYERRPSKRMQVEDDIEALQKRITELRIEAGASSITITGLNWADVTREALKGYADSGEIPYRQKNYVDALRRAIEEDTQ